MPETTTSDLRAGGGQVDLHVHFMPDSVLRKVWPFFDRAGEAYGREWPIEYRLPEPERLELWRAG
jgi:hypothetical protein